MQHANTHPHLRGVNHLRNVNGVQHRHRQIVVADGTAYGDPSAMSQRCKRSVEVNAANIFCQLQEQVAHQPGNRHKNVHTNKTTRNNTGKHKGDPPHTTYKNTRGHRIRAHTRAFTPTHTRLRTRTYTHMDIHAQKLTNYDYRSTCRCRRERVPSAAP